MRRCAIAVFLILVLLSLGAEAPKLPYLVKGVDFVVNDDGVRMRAGPGTSAAILRKLSRGTVVIPLLASDELDRIDGAAAYWYKCVLAADGSAEGWVYGAFLSLRLAAAEPLLYGLAMTIDDMGARPSYCYSFANGSFTARASPEDLPSFAGDRTIPVYDNSEGGMRLVGRLGKGLDGRWSFALEQAYAKNFMKANSPFIIGKKEGSFAERLLPANAGEAEGLKAQAALRPFVESLWKKYADPKASFRDADLCRESLMRVPMNAGGSPAAAAVYFYSYLGVQGGWTLQLDCFLVLRPDGTWTRSVARLDPSKGDYREREVMGHKGLMGNSSVAESLDFKGLPASLFRFVDSGAWEGSTYSLFATNGYVVVDLGEYYEDI